jgi:hypothetical protein
MNKVTKIITNVVDELRLVADDSTSKTCTSFLSMMAGTGVKSAQKEKVTKGIEQTAMQQQAVT